MNENILTLLEPYESDLFHVFRLSYLLIIGEQNGSSDFIWVKKIKLWVAQARKVRRKPVRKVNIKVNKLKKII